jgi:hypothetical protein
MHAMAGSPGESHENLHVVPDKAYVSRQPPPKKRKRKYIGKFSAWR